MDDFLGWQYDSQRFAKFNRSATTTITIDPATGEQVETYSMGGDQYVYLAGTDEYDQAWRKTELEEALETIYTPESAGYPDQPDNDGDGLPDDAVIRKAAAPASSAFLSWFGGHAGDSFDVGVNFVSGVGDNLTMGASKALRKHVVGYDSVDYDGTAYYSGEWVGFAAGFIGPGGVVKGAANKFDDAGRCANWLTKLWRGGCFVAGTPVAISHLPESKESLKEASSYVGKHDSRGGSSTCVAVLAPQAQDVLLPIEQVPLGARVPTKNPKPWDYDGSLPEPEQTTWRKLSLTIRRHDDGGVVEIELIRPATWVGHYNLETGKELQLNIEELQLQGVAKVTAIDDCPQIADGEGNVVTGRFLTRQANSIRRIGVQSEDGSRETIEGTPEHQIWSETHMEWVSLQGLTVGNQLRGNHGVALVVSVESREQPQEVFNVEVFGEHVYAIGIIGIVVHNTCATKAVGDIPWSSAVVRTAARKLREGATEITVNTRSQAEELFLRMFQGDGYTNTTGWARGIYKKFGKNGTYHWDDVFEEGSRVLKGHYDDGRLHNYVPHLQIHGFDKQVIRILFGS